MLQKTSTYHGKTHHGFLQFLYPSTIFNHISRPFNHLQPIESHLRNTQKLLINCCFPMVSICFYGFCNFSLLQPVLTLLRRPCHGGSAHSAARRTRRSAGAAAPRPAAAAGRGWGPRACLGRWRIGGFKKWMGSTGTVTIRNPFLKTSE